MEAPLRDCDYNEGQDLVNPVGKDLVVVHKPSRAPQSRRERRRNLRSFENRKTAYFPTLFISPDVVVQHVCSQNKQVRQQDAYPPNGGGGADLQLMSNTLASFSRAISYYFCN